MLSDSEGEDWRDFAGKFKSEGVQKEDHSLINVLRDGMIPVSGSPTTCYPNTMYFQQGEVCLKL